MKLEGKISILAHHGNNSGIEIEIEDNASGIRICTAEISMEAFAQAVTGLSSCPCNITLYQSENIGKKLEVKDELIPYPYSNSEFEKVIKDLVEPYEIDGWKADSYYTGSYNHHQHNYSNATYKMAFRRYVSC